MTSKYDRQAGIHYLSNLCKAGTPLRGRIALLSFPNEISAKAIDTAILLIEYTQLMALFLRGASKFYSEQVTNSVEIYSILSVFAKFLTPGSLLPLKKDGLETIKRVFELSVTLYVLRVSLFSYIIWLAWKRKTNSGFLVRAWQWTFYLQTKVLFNVFTSIYSVTYEDASNGILGLDSSQRYAWMVGCLIMIALEFAFSLVLTTQLTNVLPSKRFSASKNNSLELNVLVQKFANNMLRRIFRWEYSVAVWTYGPMNILFGLARIYQFFDKLPVYNYKALKLQLYLLIITFTLSVATFANVALDFRKGNMNFVIITWIILSIFCIPIATASLDKKLWALAFEKSIDTKKSPEFLIHKTIFIKQILIKNKLTISTSSRSDIHHLLFSTLNVLGSPNLEDKTTRNKVFMRYLEELMVRFPKNNFLKLYAAYCYVRKNKLYGLSTKTLAEISSNYPTVVTNKSILKHFIETRTQFYYQNGGYTLNLYDYCKDIASLSKMKLKMAEQAKLQWTLCDEITSASPDLAKILRLGNKANCLKQKIRKNFQKMSEQMPDYHIKPTLIYANYNLFLRYSPEESSKYKDLSSKRSQKYKKQFESDKLIPENLLQEDTFFLVVSGEKETAGRINYICPNFVEILERNLTGSQASVTTPPFLRANTASLVKTLTGESALAIQNMMRFQFFHHLRGYMIPVNYYLNINPSIYGGLSFLFICRRHDQSKEFILLNQEGEIESFTKEIGEVLGLFSGDGLYLLDTRTPIGQICPELAQVNQAFNITTSPPASSNKLKITDTQVSIEKSPVERSYNKLMNLGEAKEICEVYSEAGQGINITLNPITRGKSLIYRCTMRIIMVGKKVGKIVTLEKVHQEAAIVENNPCKKEEEEEASDVDEKDFEEDANSEWINFDRLKSEQQMTTRNSHHLHLQNTLSSPRQLISPRIPLISERGTTEAVEKLLTDSNEIIPVEEIIQKKKLPEKYKPHWLRTTNQSKINKIYQQTLEKPYYPFFYHGFITVLYALFFIVFMMYLYMSININQGISDLQVSKQILRLAEARNNYLGILDGTTRLIWTYAVQLSNLPDFFQGVFVSLPVAFIINQATLGSLRAVNNELFKSTGSLIQEQRENLFEKDIRLFDSGYKTYINLTSFQAIDRIIDGSLKSDDLVLTNLPSAVPSLKFVLRNAMNDILIKNTKISQSFSNSLQDKKDYFASWITVCFGTSLSLLVLIIIGFLYVLYLQAKNESKNLLALTKLKPELIHYLKQDFQVFHNLILEDDHQSAPNPANKNINSSKQAKQQQRQFPVYRKLWPIYYLYFLKFGLLILIPMILFVVNFVLFKKYLNQLSTKASQIYFIDQMNSRLGVISGSFLELTSENDTTTISNVQASVAVSYQILQISEMINEIPDLLGIENSEENGLIRNILYGDACSYLERKDQPYAFPQCKLLANYQSKPSLINLMSNFESSMKVIYSKFMNSNRTSETLLRLQLEVYNEISLNFFVVLQEENKLIVGSLNSDFENIVTQSQSLNVTLNVIILLIIAAESLIIHFLIINRLKQKETQFKQILGLFPASIVLPNFILKSYIMKTSNQTFNSFQENA